MKRNAAIVVVSLALAACGSPQAPKESAPAPAAPTAVVLPASAKSQSCAEELGADAAARLVKACLNVSPATHPPCNTANSCAMIRGEIARACKLFADQGPMDGCELAEQP